MTSFLPTNSAVPPGGFLPGSAGQMTSMVELSFMAEDLYDLDVLSKSDPMCVVYLKSLGQEDFREIGRTEKVKNSLNPQFATKLEVAYHFEQTQHLRFQLCDVDSSSRRVEDHDLLGQCECTMADIVTRGSFRMPLTDGHGHLTVSCEELSSCRDRVTLQFSAKKLDEKDLFGSSDPFLRFYRSTENNGFLLVHQTEHIKNNVNPQWSPFTIALRTLCNGDLERNIKVECLDHNRSGNHSLIGEFFFTTRQILAQTSAQESFNVIHPKKKTKKRYKNSGEVFLKHVELIKGYSFLEYIQGGVELTCSIAIDFTASNGPPIEPCSLHFLTPDGSLNQYEMAVTSVGQIIQDYDTDKLFPVLGFGAKLPNGDTSHCFFVNGHESNPYCNRIEGVLREYRSCLSRIQLYGPTNFAPVINHVAHIAGQFRQASQYFILLIITDGIITDMPQTKAAIVAASNLPLSIIIVGVGDADFDAMEELDGDEVKLTAPDGKVAVRDIVQFVAFRQFQKGMNLPMARLYLAKEVLAEVPQQFLSYMELHKIIPKPKVVPFEVLPPDP